jgi:hypothetical protein
VEEVERKRRRGRGGEEEVVGRVRESLTLEGVSYREG